MANNRYTLTPEQRRQQVQDLTQQLQDGVRSVFESENYASYLKVMSQFTHYSVRNTVLIAMQTGGQATMVAGYEAWQKKFGRHVNKGEKAIKIFAPMTFPKMKEREVIDQATGQPVRNPDGSIKKEEVEIKVPTFRVTNVFDISQTSGPPLPTLVQNLEGNVERYRDFLQAIRSISPVPIGFEEMEGKDGYYHQVEKRIAINDSLSEPQTMAALIHELTHAKMHALDPAHLKESAKARGKDQRTMEVEAESVSAVVSSYFGIDTSANSWGYVASWSRNKELPELTASLQVIKDTAGEIIDGISEEMEELRFAYMNKADALEAATLGEQVSVGVSKGRFQPVTADEILTLTDDAQFRMPKDQLSRYLRLREQMDLHPELTTLEETALLYQTDNQFGIYQISPDSDIREYAFTDHEYFSANGVDIRRSDYRLQFVAALNPEDTLDTIYERFNIDRPEAFEGHSVSVSDVIVLNHDRQIKAYFVDSFGFEEVPEFLEAIYERPGQLHEAAFRIEDRYLEIHETDKGYDYTIYDDSYRKIDGGHYESDLDVITVAKDIAQDLREPVFNTETETYNHLPVQGEIHAGSRLKRISYQMLSEITQDVSQIEDQRRAQIRQEAKEYQNKTGAFISFYAAECDEFHEMGEYYSNLPLQEAAKHYREIVSDPTRSYMGNAMGFILHDADNVEYCDSPYPLVYKDAVHEDNLKYEPVFANHPLVKEAVEELREEFQDYRFVPLVEEKEKTVAKENVAVQESPAPKKSLHERLKENKEKLSKSPGKEIQQRGVVLE